MRDMSTTTQFPETFSFLLGNSSSISSSLDEYPESLWETENVL